MHTGTRCPRCTRCHLSGHTSLLHAAAVTRRALPCAQSQAFGHLVQTRSAGCVQGYEGQPLDGQPAAPQQRAARADGRHRQGPGGPLGAWRQRLQQVCPWRLLPILLGRSSRETAGKQVSPRISTPCRTTAAVIEWSTLLGKQQGTARTVVSPRFSMPCRTTTAVYSRCNSGTTACRHLLDVLSSHRSPVAAVQQRQGPIGIRSAWAARQRRQPRRPAARRQRQPAREQQAVTCSGGR